MEEHKAEKREHNIKMQTHWRFFAADKESWREMVRGPEPEPVDRVPAARRARRSCNHHRHNQQPPPPQQPVHFQPAVAPHNYQQHAGLTFGRAATTNEDTQQEAAVRRALRGSNAYEDLQALSVNPGFFNVVPNVQEDEDEEEEDTVHQAVYSNDMDGNVVHRFFDD